MTANELRRKYFSFFEKRGHVVIPSAPLIPENDPTVLFTTAGMHPLIPYLLGEVHPAGKRLVDVQVCLRTDDIDQVGDSFHHTFFEMLGNWSLGDYWKEESISWSYEFLTRELDLDPEKIWVTCFAGDKDAPKDEESAKIWKKLGIAERKILFLGKKENWWGPVGELGPCGPDTEIFYEVSKVSCGQNCRPGDGCGRFFEIWNNVFMEYNKTKEGEYLQLKQRNVDTGMGVDRTTAIVSGLSDDYRVEDLWGPIIKTIEGISQKSYEDNARPQRIIADHLRAAVFIVSEDVMPSNKERGYILRRLIRRAVRFGKVLKIEKPFLDPVVEAVIDTYKELYPYLEKDRKRIKEIISEEEKKFSLALDRGLREIERHKRLDAKTAFFLYETYGFPLELIEEIANEKGQRIDKDIFEEEFRKHQQLSRTTSSGMFKGGLADHSEEVKKLHTATHLLHAALRKILGSHVQQKGSNITAERLRFDFSHPRKLSDQEIREVEDLVNQQIKKGLPVSFEIKTKEEALKEGALAFFAHKYGRKVKVYTIGLNSNDWFSKEICGGPHVSNTSEIGGVKIIKETSAGLGVRRIYAVTA